MAAMVRFPLSREGCKMARGKIEKRGQRRRKIKPVILIVTEGSQTEPKYFEHYPAAGRQYCIRVMVADSGGET